MTNNKNILFLIIIVLFSTTLLFAQNNVETQFTKEAQQYFLSPKIEDGNFDFIIIDFSNDIIIPQGRTLTSGTFTVYNELGEEVYSKTEALDGENIPSYTYDGIDENGEFLPDGNFVFTVSVTNDQGNESVSNPYPIKIDNTSPEINGASLITGNVIVPGKGKGISLTVDGTPEVLWKFLYREKKNLKKSYRKKVMFLKILPQCGHGMV